MNAKTALSTLLFLSLGSSALAQKATSVRLGYFPNLTHAAALVGLEKGFFQKELGAAIKLSAREFVSGTTLSEAFAAGEIDVGYVGPGPAIHAAVRGMPIQIVAGASSAGAVLVVRRGAGISSYKDLAGKKIAVPTLGNTQDISLRHILKENGLNITQNGGNVTLLPINPSDVGAAFSANQLDAALVPEPWGALLEDRGAVLVGNEKTVWRGGDYPTTVVVVNTQFALQNPETVRAFLRGHLKAVNFVNSSSAAAQTTLARKLLELTKQKVDPKGLARALKRTVISVNFSLDALKEYADLNREAGFIRELPDFSKLVNLEYLKATPK